MDELAHTGPQDTSSLVNASTAAVQRTSDSSWALPITIISTIFLVIGVTGNTIIITLVSTRKRLRTPTFTAIACLSVADLLCLSSRYVYTINGIKNGMGEEAWSMYGTVTFYFLHSANFHIVLIAYLRYVFITKPLQSVKITTKSVLKMSGGVWFAGILIGSLYCFKTMMELHENITVKNSFLFELIFGIYITFVPLLFIVVWHIMKIFKLKKTSYLSPEQPSSISRKMSLMLFVIIVIYLLSTTPSLANMLLHLICFLMDFKLAECQFFFFYHNVSVVSLCLLLNNAVNPLIYFFFSPPSLKVLRRIKQCCTKSLSSDRSTDRL